MVLGFLIALGAIVFVWIDKPPSGLTPQALLSEASPDKIAGNVLPVSATTAGSPTDVQQRVEQALLMPVFQFSEELSVLPERRKPPRAVKTANTRSSAKPLTKPVSNVASAQVSEPAPKPAPRVQKESSSIDVARAGADPVANASSSVMLKTPEAKPEISKQPTVANDVAANTPADPTLEEVVIPLNVASSPIEKQSRQLTAFERAENAFRRGVTSLRSGRMAEAESQFREAIREDWSHLASQQALVGMLIDAGRYAHAEAVLAESLSINPRQPRRAMILARLQLEGGDLDLAIETLERARPYAGTDAMYLSFLGAVLQRADRHEEAVAQYRSALAFMPRNALWLMGLGISLRAVDRDGEAMQAFEDAAAIGSLEPGLQAYVEQQRLQLAQVAN